MCSPRAAVSMSAGSLRGKQILGPDHRPVEFSSGDGARQCVLKCHPGDLVHPTVRTTAPGHTEEWVGEIIFHRVGDDVYSRVTSL